MKRSSKKRLRRTSSSRAVALSSTALTPGRNLPAVPSRRDGAALVVTREQIERASVPQILSILAAAGMRRDAITALAEWSDIRLSPDDRRFLEGPIIVHQSAWNSTLPTWVIPQVLVERTQIVLERLPFPVGPTEIMAVMYGATMDNPLRSDAADLYLWASVNAAARHFGHDPRALWMKLDMASIPSDQVVERGGRYFETYRALADEIRRKVITAQRKREPKQQTTSSTTKADALRELLKTQYDLFR